MSDFLKRKISVSCMCAARKDVLVDNAGIRYEDTYKEIGGNHLTENTDILIIMEAKEVPLLYKPFELFIDKFFKNHKYTIINGVGCTDKNFSSKDIVNTYRICKKNHIKKLIEYYNPKTIITIGRGLYTITESKDLRTSDDHFYVPIKKYCKDYKSFYEDDVYIYSNEFNCKVFPVPALYTWMPFSNYEKEFSKDQFYRVLEDIKNRKARIPKLKFNEVEDPNQFLIDLIDNKDIVNIALDTETTGLNFKRDKVFCITLSYDGLTGYYLDYRGIDKEVLNNFFASDKNFIWQNFIFDAKMLLEDGITPKCTFDIMLASHSLNENSPNGLKPLTWLYTYYGGYEDKLQEIIKKYKIKDFSKLPKNVLLEYACTDPIVTYQLWEYFKNRLELEDSFVKDNFYNYVMPAIDMIIDVERTGILIDNVYLKEYIEILQKKSKDIENEIYKIIGKEINIKSGKQLSEVFRKLPNFKVLTDSQGVPLETKKKDLVLDAAALERYSENGINIAKKIIEYNHLSKELSQFGIKKDLKKNKKGIFEKTEKEVIEKTGFFASMWEGRLFGGLKLHGTKTGRLAGGGGLDSTINFQNMPKTSEFRRIFIPEQNYILSEWDYDGMEISIGSQISGPGNLEKLITNNMDMHSYTAANISNNLTKQQISNILKSRISESIVLKKKYENKDIDQIVNNMKFDYNSIKEGKDNNLLYKELRNVAKTNNFELFYGATVYGMSKSLKIDENLAQIFFDSFFESFPEFKNYIDDYTYHAKEYGWVSTLLKRKRRLPKLSFPKISISFPNGNNIETIKDTLRTLKSVMNNLMNVAINAPIQGTSGQTTIIAMTNIRKEFKKRNMKSRILTNVHDSILFEIFIPEIDEAYEVIKHYMEKPYYENNKKNKVKLTAGDQLGIWGFGKSLEYYKENEEEFNEYKKQIIQFAFNNINFKENV